MNVWDQVGVEKYPRKICYHRIECFAVNSLAVFMWRIPSEQYCIGRLNSQRAYEGIRWDKHLSGGLDDRQLEG